MLKFSPEARIYVCNVPADLRKSIDGLSTLLVGLHLEPQSQAVYLFYNKGRDKLKGLFWDGTGFILLYKRLEKGRFKFPRELSAAYYEVEADLLPWLLSGFDFYRLGFCPHLKGTHYF